MKPKGLQNQIDLLVKNGYKVLFEAKTAAGQYQTYMVNTKGRGDVAIIFMNENTIKNNSETMILPLHVLKRFADEAVKMYDDDLTARLCAR